jgi:hypothetical protein
MKQNKASRQNIIGGSKIQLKIKKKHFIDSPKRILKTLMKLAKDLFFNKSII